MPNTVMEYCLFAALLVGCTAAMYDSLLAALHELVLHLA